MGKLTIITNNVPRPLFCIHELPAEVQKDFDYAFGYQSPRFVQYKGAWYDAKDTQRIKLLAGWHGIISETFFSGVVFRFVDDERVVVGRYFS